eukprot:869178-Pleurochrysis_carterae.AAC.1
MNLLCSADCAASSSRPARTAPPRATHVHARDSRVPQSHPPSQLRSPSCTLVQIHALSLPHPSLPPPRRSAWLTARSETRPSPR